jgi:hypothetical protein
MGNQQGTATELAWLAGIWDGEGSFSLALQRQKRGGQQKYVTIAAQAYVGMTDHPTIERVAEILDRHGVGRHIRTRSGGKRRRPLHVLQVVGLKRLSVFLPLILPYLVTKREQAEIVQEYVLSRLAKGRGITGCGYDPYEVDLFLRCRAQNQKGFQTNGARSSETIRRELERARNVLKGRWAA